MWLTCSTLIEILSACMASLPGGDDAAGQANRRLRVRTQGYDALVFRLDKLRRVFALIIRLERGEPFLKSQIFEDGVHGVRGDEQRRVGGVEHPDILPARQRQGHR